MHSALTAFLIILSILGAIGGIIWTKDKTLGAIGRLRDRWHLNRERPNFYYSELELSAIIRAKGTDWETHRKAVVFLKKPSDHIACGIVVRNRVNEPEISILPADLKLVSYIEPYSRFERYRIMFPRKILQNEGVAWRVIYKFKKTLVEDELFAWTSSIRVDLLRIRVIFEDQKPLVRWRVTDASDFVLYDEMVPLDPLTGEAKFETIAPRANLRYALVWKNKMDNE